MDDYTREMLDLKTIVSKTLEKKGVLARIRAELRANVFQAMEEEDHEAESNGSTTFSVLGTCNERSKKLHTSSSGKLLMALVCEYMEWCKLDHTLTVYMPELNEPMAYNRTELKDILGLVGEPASDSNDSRPLLMTIVESFLKEKKDLSFPGSVAQAETTRHEAIVGSRKKFSEKSMGGLHDTPFQSRSEADLLGSANDGTIRPGLHDDSQKLYEKSNRAQTLLTDVPQHRRGSEVPAFSGISRSAPNARGSSNGSANDQQSVLPGVDPRGSRDRDSDGKRSEYSSREADELHGGNSLNQKQESTWRDQDYDNLHMNSQPHTVEEDVNDQIGDHSSSQTTRTTAIENSSKALGKLHLDDDSATEFGDRQSSASRVTSAGQQSQAAPRDNSSSIVSAGNKKQASAYFYSDSEEENAPE